MTPSLGYGVILASCRPSIQYQVTLSSFSHLTHQVASCSYFQYGGAGEQSAVTAICILSLNVVIDKVNLNILLIFVLSRELTQCVHCPDLPAALAVVLIPHPHGGPQAG